MIIVADNIVLTKYILKYNSLINFPFVHKKCNIIQYNRIKLILKYNTL